MHGDRKIYFFPVQLTTSRIGNLIWLIHTLLYVMTIHTYVCIIYIYLDQLIILYIIIKTYLIIMYYIVFVVFLLCTWYMLNGVFFPGIIMLNQCYYTIGEPV